MLPARMDSVMVMEIPAQHVRMDKTGNTHSMFTWVKRDSTTESTNNKMFRKAMGLPHTVYDGWTSRWFRHTVDSPGTHWMHVPPKYGRRAKPLERSPKVSCAWDTLLEDF